MRRLGGAREAEGQRGVALGHVAGNRGSVRGELILEARVTGQAGQDEFDRGAGDLGRGESEVAHPLRETLSRAFPRVVAGGDPLDGEGQLAALRGDSAFPISGHGFGRIFGAK